MPHTVSFGPDGSVWIPCYNDTVLGYGLDQILAGDDAGPRLVLG